MARKRRHEEHTNHEAWAIPYGDLITLLLAFFVVMYAISSVNDGKYRILSDSLSAAFRGGPRSMQPIEVGARRVSAEPNGQALLVTEGMRPGKARSQLEAIAAPTAGIAGEEPSAEELARLKQAANAAAARRAQLDRIAGDVEQAMASLIMQDQVVVRRHDDWVEVEIRTDILFGSGSAALAAQATSAIAQLGDALRDNRNPIRVEGHTDNVPIRTSAFASNWELSAARAASVVRILVDRGIDPSRLAVLGLGEFRPAQPNDTITGRGANRRVLLVILGDDQAPEGSYAADRGTSAEPLKVPVVASPTTPVNGIAN
jgi:chemotaxis protein MotB